MHADTLSIEEKQTLYRDGFIILKQAVPPSVVEEAQARINGGGHVVGRRHEKGTYLGDDPAMTDLVNKSAITPILHEALDDFDPPSDCQVAILRPGQPGDYFNNLGYRDRDMPYNGTQCHMDGLCTIAAPQEVQAGTPDEIYHRYLTNGPKGDIGRSADVVGHNTVPLFQDPAMTLGMGSFNAFVFVCLNDQTRPECGQTSVLKGAHHATEAFFQRQRALGEHIGPEGPGWPRMNHDVPNRCGLNYLPEQVRNQFTDESSATTPDGVRWPEPTPALMEPGDACIAMFHIPHSGSRNEKGTEDRKNVIFRIRCKSRQPDKVITGRRDYPDRGEGGTWLEYEEGNNPWERSKHALCHQWDEWRGMQDVVASERADA
ncbi:MAG: hypothetical protein CMQ05_15155 [Gammaproteobacteria bacterium]|nr:hypothetical protein [Gammaproteobacteria bacterium]RPG26020.1 MAG: hypothetical protein CBC10_005105 [Gammaproteobacteria bacterium TMED50]